MLKMLEEVRQQPSALAKTLEKGFRSIRSLQRHFIGHRPRLIVIAARGTSDNAAEFGRYLIEITTGIPVSLAAPSIVTLYRSAVDLHDVLRDSNRLDEKVYVQVEDTGRRVPQFENDAEWVRAGA